ncbi:MAG: TIGR01777 family oxidoreductase [Chlorobium sp.]|uniref:TIGR01777 family oxidoreductase n=1 Tax=Chlorobium sp. TaxID=1095 RepID=UPI0025BEB80E|nr:TIGR01777 family oxidoreductase [Chlorobium sp.]MCF8216351.1 TIGR01777 family oxidoreductase [Chlorobium sp.]MCF8271254.1 TIGR01777 family oxidoreductase [Chlorobium sp.]MCF8287628.1 TIGR01777 family oxidoreductase [Chlorobium sp.]MCF8291167.1 TIGR01777 family oxidoreductase [Chlorobium sp.]MCF8385262.1 TIGR01777 family oxidoreductase [Chlorobium sp.]
MDGHIVITGATGVIGIELVRKLISRGEKVVVLARSTGSAREKAPGAAEYLGWDAGMESGEWVSSVDGAKAVIHLAGKPLLDSRWTEEHKLECYDSRIESTKHMVAAIARAKRKPEVFISASAIGYYGSFDQCGDTPDLDESGIEGSDFLARICVDWEKAAQPAWQLGVRLVLLRTGIVLSTKGGMLQKMITPFSLFLGGPVGSGKQCLSWIHIDDEVDSILAVLDDSRYQGAVNAVAPVPAAMSEFAHELGNVMGRPSFFPVPKLAVQLLLGEGADYAVKGQRVVPRALLQNGFVFRYPDLGAALRDLVSGNK